MSMNPDCVELHDGRPGVRTLVQVVVREAAEDPQATMETKGETTQW